MNMNRRTPLTKWDVLSIDQVAKELQIHRSKALKFLKYHNIIQHEFGNSRIIWGDVLKALRENGANEFPDLDTSW